MGPTNVALVKLFQIDQVLRAAQDRYDNAARSVRLLERRVNELTAKVQATQQLLREQQAKAGELDLDLKSRDAHIEKLRTQQQLAKTHKEYQAFLTEINTEKTDRNKVEDEAIKALENVERTQGELKALQAQLAEEQKKLDEIRSQLGGRLSELQAEIDKVTPSRQAAYAEVPARIAGMYDRLAERHEGEAMSPLQKPDPREEEYICGACNMSLVVDIYNRLHSRDDLVQCPSCGRLLFIPDELPVEVAINKPKEAKEPKEPKAARTPRSPRGKKKTAPSPGDIGAAPNRQESAEAVVNSVTMEEDSQSPAAAVEPASPANSSNDPQATPPQENPQ